jgi:hypothetical protein
VIPFWRRRRDRDPLGNGVWRRAHDRFRRGVDRYHQLLERVPPGAVHDRLAATGARLAAAAEEVHRVAASAQALAPSEGDVVPSGHGGVLLDAHRALSRAATMAAQAGETVMLAVVALRAGRSEEAAGFADAAARAADQVTDEVHRTRDLLGSPDGA